MRSHQDLYRLNIEEAVVLPAWFSVAVDHTSGNSICALNVRVVKALYVSRQIVKREQLLNLNHQLVLVRRTAAISLLFEQLKLK